MLVRSQQAELIVEKRLIRGCNNDGMEVKPRLRDCDHTVAVKTAL